MELVTIAKEFNDAEAQLKRARLEAAGFHPFIVDKLSTSIGGGGVFGGSILVQVPESEADDAREFLNAPFE